MTDARLRKINGWVGVTCAVLLVLVFAQGCSHMPWCKDAAKWTERLNVAQAVNDDARAAAETLHSTGIITDAQYHDAIVACDAADTAIGLARQAIALCVKGIGAPANAEENVTRAERDATIADGVVMVHKSAATRKAGTK